MSAPSTSPSMPSISGTLPLEAGILISMRSSLALPPIATPSPSTQRPPPSMSVHWKPTSWFRCGQPPWVDCSALRLHRPLLSPFPSCFIYHFITSLHNESGVKKEKLFHNLLLSQGAPQVSEFSFQLFEPWMRVLCTLLVYTSTCSPIQQKQKNGFPNQTRDGFSTV